MKWLDGQLKHFILSMLGYELYNDRITQRLLSTGYHVILFFNLLALVVAWLIS